MNKACQSIYDLNGNILLAGEWSPQLLYEVITESDVFWKGKKVLDIGANTCGLSIEIARRGGVVTAIEPDPYGNTYAVAKEIVADLISSEGLHLHVEKAGLFDAHLFGSYDVILCLGLLYHFRYPQYILDYLSTIEMDTLILSTQVAPGEEYALVNRASPGILKTGLLGNEVLLSGWHPTRPLIERMLAWAGFGEITSLTSKPFVFPEKQKGLTNSAYYRAKKISSCPPDIMMKEFYPR